MDFMGKMMGFGGQEDEEYEVEEESYGSRMGSAMCGMCLGVILFLGSFGAIGWNELNFVRNAKILAMAAKDVNAVECTPDDKYGGKPVFMSCPINSAYDFAQDSDIGALTDVISLQNLTGAFLTANAEIYQWKEEKSCKEEKFMGKVTKKCQYEYKQDWFSSVQDSNKFCSTNKPKSCKFPGGGDKSKVENTGSIPTNLAFGRKAAPEFSMMVGDKDDVGYLLNEGLIGSLTQSEPLEVKSDAGGSAMIKKIMEEQKLTVAKINGDTILLIKAEGATSTGDLRIKFGKSAAKVGDDVSILASQDKDKGTKVKLLPWDTGMKGTQGTMNTLKDGKMTLEELLAEKADANRYLTWILRFACWLVMFCSLQCITGPISLAPEIIPCVGDMLGDLIGCMLACVNCMVSTILTLIAVGIAFLIVRPMVGGPMLGAALLLCVVVYCFKRNAPARKGKKILDEESGPAYGSVGAPQYAQQPVFAQPAVAVAQPIQQAQFMAVQCPEGTEPGQQVQVQAPDGRMLVVEVPEGVAPGQQFQVQI